MAKEKTNGKEKKKEHRSSSSSSRESDKRPFIHGPEQREIPKRPPLSRFFLVHARHSDSEREASPFQRRLHTKRTKGPRESVCDVILQLSRGCCCRRRHRNNSAGKKKKGGERKQRYYYNYKEREKGVKRE